MRHQGLLLVTLLTLVCVSGCARDTTSAKGAPAVDHILLEVADLKASIAFYHDLLALPVKSNDGHFAMLQAGNMSVALWDKRQDWEAPRASGERQGLGMYPHFKVGNVADVVDRARKMGYKIVQEPKKYLWGTEAFIADPDGYVWALIN